VPAADSFCETGEAHFGPPEFLEKEGVMYQDTQTVTDSRFNSNLRAHTNGPMASEADGAQPSEDLPSRVVALMDRGKYRSADAMLTRMLVDDRDSPHLWLAAGVCRLMRGKRRSAQMAMKMYSWMTGDVSVKKFCDSVLA